MNPRTVPIGSPYGWRTSPNGPGTVLIELLRVGNFTYNAIRAGRQNLSAGRPLTAPAGGLPLLSSGTGHVHSGTNRQPTTTRAGQQMSTFMANRETVQQKWFIIDATDLVVGRLAVMIANVLRGKH